MGLGTVDERPAAAMNQTLRESYEAYHEAFFHDLNHFWSGLAALQDGDSLSRSVGGGRWLVAAHVR